MNRGTRRAALAAATLIVIAGCAGVPDSGPVRVGQPVAAAPGGGLSAATVREVPAGPLPGAGPVQLVSGFLRSMLDSEGGYGIARSYLAPGTKWPTGGDITVYAEPTRVVRTGPNTVVVLAQQAGALGPHGVYRVATGAMSRRFQVIRRNGQWRIAGLQPGILLSSDDAGRLLQPAALYFLNPAGDHVVPQPVLEPPEEPGLATVLMRELLAGPSPFLAPGVRTAAPRGTTLVGNVPISATGVADVDLSAGARQIGSVQLRRLSAQVVWTLRQLSSVTAVRLLANGAPLEAAGVPSLQPVASWPEFDPAETPPAHGALLIRGDRVVGLGTAVPPALRLRGALAAARSADGSVVAVLRHAGSHQELLIGPASGPLRVRLRAGSITAPAFGPNHDVLAATATGAVYSLAPGTAARPVGLTGRLRGKAVRALAVSGDGARVAVVAESSQGFELDVAVVDVSGGQIVLRKPRLILPAGSQVAGVAWTGATELVSTVMVSSHRREVVQLRSDGFQVQDLAGPGIPSDLDQVAATPGQRVLAADPAGTWQLAGQRWRKVSSATAPGYAGG
ncbi:MAG: LpqB family beta-propeller domain-containing protein [Mycobacteriales bacterium]